MSKNGHYMTNKHTNKKREQDEGEGSPWLIPRRGGGVLNFELGTEVRPEVSTTTL